MPFLPLPSFQPQMRTILNLFRQGGDWLRSSTNPTPEILVFFTYRRHWQSIRGWCFTVGQLLLLLVLSWSYCFLRGFGSLISMDSTALFLTMWGGYLSFTSVYCVLYGILGLGTAGATVHYLDYTSGLVVLGTFGLLSLWIYGNFWLTAIIFIVAGYMFSVNCPRLLIITSMTYVMHRVYVYDGWLGIFLSLNAAFLSNDLLYVFIQQKAESKEFEFKESHTFTEDFPKYYESCIPRDEDDNASVQEPSQEIIDISNSKTDQKNSSSVKVVKTDPNSVDEMKRIINSSNHYDAIGFPRRKYIDLTVLRKEYRKKAMLVHPDKNMGNPLASESFKKLQCAYEVLSDIAKKKDYDEHLRSEECRSVSQRSYALHRQNSVNLWSQESRHIECAKCGYSHLWICTTRIKSKARWCQDCHLHHPAKDGDGWVELERVTAFSTPRKADIPRAYVCAESKIFDVSEWASCQFQGTSCRANTHCPTFRVNKVSLNRTRPISDPTAVYQWELHAEMMSEEEEFELWVEQAMASGLLTSKQKKNWSPFKILNQNKKGMNSRRMSLP